MTILRSIPYLSAALWTALCLGPASAQSTRGYDLAIPGVDYFSDAVPTSDGGLCALSSKVDTTSNTEDIMLVKLNADLVEEWTRIYHRAQVDRSGTLQQMDDGGYTFTCLLDQIGLGSFMVRTDAEGFVQWSRSFGVMRPLDMQMLPDSGYVVAGFSGMIIVCGGGGYTMANVARLDAAGHTLWNYVYDAGLPNSALAVEATMDGGFAFCGWMPQGGVNSNGSYLAKLDSTGQLQWAMSYDNAGVDDAIDLVQMADSGFVVAGMTPNFRLSLTRTDAAGHALWQYSYPCAGIANEVLIDEQGDLVVVCKMPSTSAVGICKFSPDGVLLWCKEFPDHVNSGQLGLTSIWEDQPGHYTFLMHTLDGGQDVHVFMTDGTPDPCTTQPSDLTRNEIVTPEILLEWFAIPSELDTAMALSNNIGSIAVVQTCPSTINVVEHAAELDALAVSPIPASDQVTISCPSAFRGTRITLFDGQGAVVATYVADDASMIADIRALAPGMYMLVTEERNGQRLVARLIRGE